MAHSHLLPASNDRTRPARSTVALVLMLLLGVAGCSGSTHDAEVAFERTMGGAPPKGVAVLNGYYRWLRTPVLGEWEGYLELSGPKTIDLLSKECGQLTPGGDDLNWVRRAAVEDSVQWFAPQAGGSYAQLTAEHCELVYLFREQGSQRVFAYFRAL